MASAAPDTRSELAEQLSQAGLDAEYWAGILKTKFGITRMEQTKHIQIEDLKKVKDAVHYDWEEKALRNCFGISDEACEASLGKLGKQFKQKLDEAKELLGEVVQLKQEGIHHTDDTEKSKVDQLRRLMNIPEEQWVEKYDDQGLGDMISKMNSDLQNLGKLAEGTTVSNASEILENASAGLALKGILVGKDFNHDCEKRNVLCAPTDVKLMNPLMLPVDESVHFSSKAQSDYFHRSLDTMGYSVAATVKGGGWGFQTKAGFSKNYEKEDEIESESHQQTHFESKVMYSVVPTAACEFNPHSLKLSQHALHELKTIDELLVGRKNPKLVDKKCEQFLKSYGSHINAGVLHFGGVNKFVATYTSETKSKSDKIQSMLRDALSAYASASYSGFGFRVGGSVSADHINTHGSFTADYEKSEGEKTSLYTTRNGGPQEVIALPLWKMGLVACNNTWALIDRGKTLSRDFVGIWKLIPNHEGVFLEPYKLASSLKTVWEKMSGCLGSSDQGQTVIKGPDAIDLLMDKISAWNSHPVLPEIFIEYLQEVLKTIDQVETQTGTNKYWVDKLCTEVDISSFLGKVVELKGNFDSKNMSVIRCMIRKLVNPAVFREFPGKQKIMKWAELDVPSILANAGVKSIPDLMRNVKERFVPNLQGEHAKNTEGDVQVGESINARATDDLELCLDQLLKDLKSSGESHKVFFLNVTLLPLHYDWSSMKFETFLTTEKVKNFVQGIEKLWEKFQAQKDKGIIQLEAFLIHTLLTSGHFDKGKESSEDQFAKITNDLRQVLSPKLNQVLNRHGTHSPFNWVEMTSVTGQLAKGNMSVAEEKKVDIGDLQEVFASHDRKIQEEGPIKTCKPGVAAQGAFSEILKTLGLEEYYPSKISLLNAMVIKKATGHPMLVDLPWMIIHKLLMIDFHARDQLLPVVKESEGGEKPDAGESEGGEKSEEKDEDGFDLDAFLLEPQSTSNGEEKITHLNTLDVLVAIFTCCDNFLKQTLAQKLFVCKLAVPFLYPLGLEDNIVMSLWALRTITVQCHSKGKEATETPVTDKPFPLVTFVRLGRPPLSKSKLMNDILRDDSHDTFYNHDCSNGTVARRVTDGLVECSWFITAGKEKEHLTETTMFLNLRGDASSIKKQMQILQKISSVVFVIVTAQDLARNPHTNTYKQIVQTCRNVILFLISGRDKQSIQERKACVEAVGKDFLKRVRVISSSNNEGTQKNASDLKTEARGQLSKAIAGCSGMVLEEYAGIAKEKGIIIDEYDDETCLEGKHLAEKVLIHMKDKQIFDCKRLLLPLQGAEWIEYCKLLKKQHRTTGKGSQSSSAHASDHIKQQMDRLRGKQVELCHRLTPFIKDFMSTLQKKPDVVLYFLKWMNMLLDKKSRANLPGLRRQYHTLWTQFQEAKKKQDKAHMQILKTQVDYAENQLASASLGLENLFRELGQVYEAVKGSGKVEKETRAFGENLPEIAAKLLVKGNPLELVDGDASSVPISWLRAVLQQLGNIIGEKRLFVLSVLGIQSSGKSTLLNTMFGLQFAVSAGRCTRGAYMQLIPVDDHAELPFDYVVVVDTEGLRAPELGHLKYDHDNELATLVIGLGDVTMVNIKGENTAEMKNILQIAVHAFLRMKLVSKDIKDHRTCIFVHQNVPAANAEQLMMHGCQKLQEGLDDMAKEAADSENIADIHSFSQIINIDIQNHVWYFSDLWHGNPPMAPANPGYSEKVGAVRLSILREIAKRQTTFLTTSDLSIRLDDLWNGILADDFVFSFRNSLEVKAYNSLQSTYYTLEWDLKNELKTWLQKAEINLKMCETIGNLDSFFQKHIHNLSDVLIEKAEKIKTRLGDYFEKNNLQDIIIQWQESKLNQLKFAIEQQEIEGKTYLISIKEARRMELMQTEKWAEHEGRIMSKAVELADEMKGKNVTDDELKTQFNTMLVPMVQELTTKSADEELRMDEVMEQVLRHRFHAHGNFLRDELKSHPLDSPLKQTFLEGSITLDDVREDDISLKPTLLKKIKNLAGTNNTGLHARHKTLELTSSILREISSDLKALSNNDMKVQSLHATEVVQKIAEKIETYNETARVSKDCTFTIRPQYIVKLAVHVSRHCVQVFSKMQFEYNKKHGVKAKLEEYKNTAWSVFKNMVKQSTDEVIAGDILCTQLEGIIEKAVKEAIPRQCIDEGLRHFQMNKYYLIVKMMDDLACKGNFKAYASYIKSAKEFALEWITQFTNEKMFSRQDGSGMSRYAEITKSHIGRIKECISKSVKHATGEIEEQGGRKMALWIDKFCQRVSEEIAVPVSTLKHVSARKVMNFSNLQRIILDQIDSVQANLEKAFANETKDSVQWDGTPPPQQILDKIWGCPEQCPFCKEPCADTTDGHYSSSGRSHMCVQHRPEGIGGIRWKKDVIIDGVSEREGQLIHETCSYSIQCKNRTFDCTACNLKCQDHGKCSSTGTDYVDHNCIEYKTYIKDWDIAPDPTNSTSKYWMWFMMTYKNQLKDMYDAQLPAIPGSWESITKEEALDDLRKIHN